MKKGLLLSVVASTVIFAGGDIAPVEPAAAAPAASCSDFYGQIGAFYQTQAADSGDLFDVDTVGADGNYVARTDFMVAAVVGVEKEIANGIGFGAEVAGWSALGWPESDNNVGTRVDLLPGEDRVDNAEGAELSQLYMTASFNNTAVKVGRFALPYSLSPYAWTDRTGGVAFLTFEGGLVANTDLADTTVYGAYVRNATNLGDRVVLGADDIGLFALGMVNKSIANTTIGAVGYYTPDAALDGNGDGLAVYAGFLTVARTFGDYKVTGLAAAIGGDEDTSGLYAANDDGDTTFAVEADISGKFGMFDAKLAASYVNDGSFVVNLGNGYSALATDLAESVEVYTGVDGLSHAVTGVALHVGAKVGIGRLYGSLGYWDFDTTADGDRDNTVGARVGYKFKVAGIDTKVEYRYRNRTIINGDDEERNRVRIEAAYKF